MKKAKPSPVYYRIANKVPEELVGTYQGSNSMRGNCEVYELRFNDEVSLFCSYPEKNVLLEPEPISKSKIEDMRRLWSSLDNYFSTLEQNNLIFIPDTKEQRQLAIAMGCELNGEDLPIANICLLELFPEESIGFLERLKRNLPPESPVFFRYGFKFCYLSQHDWWLCSK
jgi:hypothetical protein